MVTLDKIELHILNIPQLERQIYKQRSKTIDIKSIIKI